MTGATAVFGDACTRLFIKEGAKVVATGRRRERLEALKKELGDHLHIAQLDVRNREDVHKVVENLPPAFSQIDVLVNNAGLVLGLDPYETLPPADIAQMIETNIFGVTHCTSALLPGMIKHNRGHIINVSSVAGNWPYPGGNVYGATKAFVTQFSLNLRNDLLGKNVRVTNIEPGMCETEFSLVRFKGDQEKADAVYAGIKALTADDIANTILWTMTQPEHVNVNRIELMPTQQAFAGFSVHREVS